MYLYTYSIYSIYINTLCATGWLRGRQQPPRELGRADGWPPIGLSQQLSSQPGNRPSPQPRAPGWAGPHAASSPYGCSTNAPSSLKI